MSQSQLTVDRPRQANRTPQRWLVIAVLAILVALIIGNVVQARAHASRTVPQNAAIEKVLGVRFSRVAVVADGGLITVSYVVLDPEKASRFQLDGANPPVLHSEARGLSTKRVSLMKQGHTLRAGQTYYLVYQNTKGALRSGEQVTIDAGALHLRHVPVV